jgi:uncharacterized protein
MGDTMLLWKLFLRLRRAGMKLSIDQYEQARQSLYQGYGLAGWEDLKEICRLLWVKPHINYDSSIFEREFDLHRLSVFTPQSQQKDESVSLQPQESISKPKLEVKQLGTLPQIPPRVFQNQMQVQESMQTTIDQGEEVGAAAAKGGSGLPLKLIVPLNSEQVQQGWRSMSQPTPDLRRMEVDFRKTERRIARDGTFWEEAQKPLLQKGMKYLVLVDDSNAMVPYSPVIEPLIDAITSKHVPAQIWRFNSYPADFLYHWQHPLQGRPISLVLSHYQDRNAVIIVVSDGGAASRSYQDQRVQGMKKFIDRLPRLNVLWLNPVPAERWEGTSAEVFAEGMADRMIEMEPRSWSQLVKEVRSRSEV